MFASRVLSRWKKLRLKVLPQVARRSGFDPSRVWGTIQGEITTKWTTSSSSASARISNRDHHTNRNTDCYDYFSKMSLGLSKFKYLCSSFFGVDVSGLLSACRIHTRPFPSRSSQQNIHLCVPSDHLLYQTTRFHLMFPFSLWEFMVS